MVINKEMDTIIWWRYPGVYVNSFCWMAMKHLVKGLAIKALETKC